MSGTSVKSMKILYDSLGFLEPHGGVSRYFTELIRHLPSGVEWEIAADETYNAFLKESPFDLPEARHSIRKFWPGFHFKGKSFVYRTLARLGVYSSMELANERRFAAALKKDDFDVLHLTGPHGCGTVWRQYAGSAKVVMTVHDLIPDMWWKGVRGEVLGGVRITDDLCEIADERGVIERNKNTEGITEWE